MSYSTCIKCSIMVSLYEKYCPTCVNLYNLKQDENWHKNPFSYDNKEEEFEKDKISAIHIDWESQMEISHRYRTLTARFVLTQKEIEEAMKAESIYVDGIHYEVPVDQLMMTVPGLNLLTLKEKK